LVCYVLLQTTWLNNQSSNNINIYCTIVECQHWMWPLIINRSEDRTTPRWSWHYTNAVCGHFISTYLSIYLSSTCVSIYYYSSMYRILQSILNLNIVISQVSFFDPSISLLQSFQVRHVIVKSIILTISLIQFSYNSHIILISFWYNSHVISGRAIQKWMTNTWPLISVTRRAHHLWNRWHLKYLI